MTLSFEKVYFHRHTIAISSIPGVPLQTCTIIRSFGVCTVSIIMTNVSQVLVLRG